MSSAKRKVWIIAYFFQPDKKVGALRASYWYHHLGEVGQFEVEVITAEKEAKGSGVHVIPKKGSSFFSRLIKDDGIIWKENIKEFVMNNAIDSPDVVIITGSPFMHFGITSWLKKKYECKVILDYRDPFAMNPGFKNSGLKMQVKRYFECKFNVAADGILTVNRFCADLICGFYRKPNAIIQNGYDERVEVTELPVHLQNPSFVYTGKFYFDPEPIVEAMKECGAEFHYAGPDGSQMNLEGQNGVIDHGFIKYEEAAALISSNDVGIIQTYGEDFQSTTKLFDYIRFSRAILIISDKYLHRGSIHEELNAYPNVFWSKNDTQSILNAVEEIKKSVYIFPDKQFSTTYSRGSQMERLIHFINDELYG